MSHPNGGAHPHAFDEYDAGDDALASPQSYDGLDESFEDGFDDGFDAAEQAGDGFDEDGDAFEGDGAEDALDDGFEDGFEDGGDAGDAQLDALDAYQDDMDGMDLGDDLAEGPAAPSSADAALSLFEAEVADALDADGTDEFLGSLLGGFSRVASRLAANPRLNRVAPHAARYGGYARTAGNIAKGAGSLADVGALLAQRLGHQNLAQGLQRFGRVAGTAGGVLGKAGTAMNLVGGLPGHLNTAAGYANRMAQANPIGALLARFGMLSADDADEFEAFDSMADLYEDGVDAALPAAVGIAARLAARALGGRALSQLSPTSRRAFVHGIAMAARHLVRNAGPGAVRALPRLAVSSAQAARSKRTPPRQVPQQVGRTVVRAARAASRRPRALRRLAQPHAAPSASLPAPAARGGGRSPGLGRGVPSISRGSMRRFVLHGPVELTIRPL